MARTQTAPTAERATASIVSFGYDGAALFDGQPAVTIIANAQASVSGMSSVIGGELRRAHGVIVVYARWLPDAAVVRLQTARAALSVNAVALVGVDLPPLAGGVLSTLAIAVQPHLAHAGELVGAIPRIVDELVVAAWLRGVTGLRQPSPSMAQHVMSPLWDKALPFSYSPRRSSGGSTPNSPCRSRLPTSCRRWSSAIMTATWIGSRTP